MKMISPMPLRTSSALISPMPLRTSSALISPMPLRMSSVLIFWISCVFLYGILDANAENIDEGKLLPIPVCKPGMFDCGDETGCISSSWVCDGDLDCNNGKDEQQSCCSVGKQFECVSNGLCIDLEYRCDAFADCSDSSDEMNCTTCANSDLYHCDSFRCIDPVFLCDQDNDCGDFSDELNCDVTKPNTYICQNERKIVRRHQLCDGVNDCGDMSDEIGCAPCEAFHYKCNNSEGCVLVFELCDGVSQCADGSDESWCEVCGKSDEFLCDDGKCIQASLVCNSADDCSDGSDERHCECNESEFECWSGFKDFFNASNVGLKCIPSNWVCDGMDDCNDGEDEDVFMCSDYPMFECAADEFECADGECILNSMVCDGEPQCSSGEDELSCPVICPSSTYQLCVTGDECISYDQFCDGVQDCADNSDESFTNGYCVCSGILCGSGCIPIEKICDSTWDCANGEDEQDCAKCKPNLRDTKSLLDQAELAITLIRSTYTELDNFQIYFAAIAEQWDASFGDKLSPFHIDLTSQDPDSEVVVRKAQQFLISIVSIRPTLKQFVAVLGELGFTNQGLTEYKFSDTLENYKTYKKTPNQKRFIIERTDKAEVYQDLIARCEYLRQKSADAVQVLSAITKTLHFDFSTCADGDILRSPMGSNRGRSAQYNNSNKKKRSMRDVFTALTLVQNGASREDITTLISKLYDLDSQLRQLTISVQSLDYLIATVSFVIDDARSHISLGEGPETITEEKQNTGMQTGDKLESNNLQARSKDLYAPHVPTKEFSSILAHRSINNKAEKKLYGHDKSKHINKLPYRENESTHHTKTSQQDKQFENYKYSQVRHHQDETNQNEHHREVKQPISY